MIITVSSWAEWQQTDGNWKRVGWFKIHRAMRGNRRWRQLSYGAAKLLVDVLTLTDHDTGTVQIWLDDLCYEIREPDHDTVLAWLSELEEVGWLTLAHDTRDTHARARADRASIAGDSEKQTTAIAGADPPKGGRDPASPEPSHPPPRGREKFGPDEGPQRIKIDDPETVH